jgi:hypothetical protein
MRDAYERFAETNKSKLRVFSCAEHLLATETRANACSVTKEPRSTMNSKTRPYRNQHVQLAHLVAAVPSSMPIEDPSAALAALSRVRSVLLVHLRLESGLLYPWMLQRATEVVCERVRRHRDDMGWLSTSFLEFCGQWSSAASISADPRGFVKAWSAERALLSAHLDAEQDDLYDVADGYADARLALAS